LAITLKAARVNRGYTQREAAALIDVTEDTISNWERGKSFPNVPQLKKIEEVYGVTYNDLIFLHNNNG
jgi:transcriptional regulator with XRE-family HTH domain